MILVTLCAELGQAQQNPAVEDHCASRGDYARSRRAWRADRRDLEVSAPHQDAAADDGLTSPRGVMDGMSPSAITAVSM
jgi:hypothetical protein